MKQLLGIVLLGAVLCGCVGQSADDQRAKANEFSEDAVEQAMIESGQQKELEEARKREAEYMSAGQGQDQTQEGPTNAPGQGGN